MRITSDVYVRPVPAGPHSGLLALLLALAPAPFLEINQPYFVDLSTVDTFLGETGDFYLRV